jgi:hypothetical protein
MRTIILIGISTLAFSCSRDYRPFPSKLLVGINDTATYHFGRDGRTAMVVKKEYLDVWLHRDTIELGENFHALFAVYLDSLETLEIIVTKPSYLKLTREDYDRLGKDEALSYTLKMTQKGMFDFEGVIKRDSVVQPFRWKFLVTEGTE